MGGSRRINKGLPCRSQPSGQDVLVPQVDQQGSIDDRFDVSRSTLSENRLVELGALPAVR
jgi:hypothetical protein